MFVIAQVLIPGSGKEVEKYAELKYGLCVLASLGSLFGFAAALSVIYNWRTIYAVLVAHLVLFTLWMSFAMSSFLSFW